MRRGIRVTSLLLWFLLATPLSAYANDAPGVDGMLSVLMIVPIAILGLRLAGVKVPPGGKIKRLLRGLALGFSILFFTLFFTVFLGSGGWALGGLMMGSYGVLRGRRAIKHGQGRKRFAIGLAVIVFTLIAVADYVVSFRSLYLATHFTEGGAAIGVLTIVIAETEFQSAAKLDTNQNGVGEFGTIEQLMKAGLLGDIYIKENPRRGYRYVLVLSEDPARAEKEFFVYATPEDYGSSEFYVPGSSLWAVARPPKLVARRTFACDETRVCRAADLGTSRAVTRAEAQKWNPVN
ncbi:MAG: hypothetical protein ABSA70_10890 [Terriglobia bacterium]